MSFPQLQLSWIAGNDPFACQIAGAWPQHIDDRSYTPEASYMPPATGLSSNALHLSDLPDNLKQLISQAITRGVAAGLHQQCSASVVLESLACLHQDSLTADLPELLHQSPNHSIGSDDSFVAEGSQRELDLDDEGIS